MEHFRKYTPNSVLKPFIKSYMIIESRHGMENSIIPDTSIVAAFRLKGIVKDKSQPNDDNLPELVFSGLRKQPRIINYTSNTATLLVNFKIGGASAFFETPLHILFGKNVALEDFIPKPELTCISESLQAANDDLEKISLIEHFFETRLYLHNHTPDLLIKRSIEIITREKGDLKIHSLIKILNISKDPFEKRFRYIVGASPKQFANIIRLKKAIENYSMGKSLTKLALDAGYYDQAHFIHDFKTFTGETPSRFFPKLIV